MEKESEDLQEGFRIRDEKFKDSLRKDYSDGSEMGVETRLDAGVSDKGFLVKS